MLEENKEVKTEVKVETPTPKEDVTSPEVKVEPVVVNDVEISKLKEQISNLNTALKGERDGSRTEINDLKSKLEALEADRDTISKMRDVFTPKTQNPDVPEEEDIATKFESLWEEKEQKRKEEEERERRKNLIQSEVKTLTEEWNGSDGKPKYDDDDVIKWQQTNKKLHLTPSEAFREMKHNELMEYEISKRLSSTPGSVDAVIPGAAPQEREPKSFVPSNESETRDAVMEAINNASLDVNN